MASTLSLLLLSLLSPLAHAGPILANRDSSAPGCSSTSFGDFAWAVEDFTFNASYVFTTPAHQNSWGYANFGLTNPATGVRASCSGTSNQLQDFFYGTVPYTCQTVGGQAGTTTTFDFSRPSGLLRVNQTWSCSDNDPQFPTTFHGYGAVNLTLTCTDKTTQNPNWTTGQIYSDREIECQPVDTAMKLYEINAVA